jgi:hypothetical protein
VKALALVVVLAAAPAQAQMYKCVDPHGLTRYTDSAGPGCKPVDIRGSPPISGAIRAPESDLAKDEADFRRRQAEREAAAATQQQTSAERCSQLRREHAVLSASRRVVRINEKGESEYMEDGTREERVAQLKRELARCP